MTPDPCAGVRQQMLEETKNLSPFANDEEIELWVDEVVDICVRPLVEAAAHWAPNFKDSKCEGCVAGRSALAAARAPRKETRDGE